MLLHDLLWQFDPSLELQNIPNLTLTGLAEDSRRVTSGNLFIARGSFSSGKDGRTFLTDAASRGAAAAIVPAGTINCPLPAVGVADPASAASILAHLFYGQPSQSLKVLAVTGTNGKTTTTYLIRHLLQKFDLRCGMIGTVQNDDGNSCVESTLTTPSAIDIAEFMSAMRRNGCAACAIETSSHALHQSRVAGVRFAAAAFTNLTGDHLDYHRDMESYAAAKARLFESLDESAIAVVNATDEWSKRMIRDCRARVVRFGFNRGADYRAQDIAVTSHGTHFILTTPDGQAEVSMNLIGKHNIENALTAAAMIGETFGFSAQQIAAALADAQGAPGRLQSVRTGQPFAVLVDYAHTDDALENVLSALRPLTRGSLRLLFGCGGDRDKTKRPRMAKTAENLADVVYVTSDNPRTENPGDIIDQILAGFSRAGRKNVIVEPDRRAAIARVLADAQPSDVVLLAGKGHENYQLIGTTKHHFDDVEEATRLLSAHSAAA